MDGTWKWEGRVSRVCDWSSLEGKAVPPGSLRGGSYRLIRDRRLYTGSVFLQSGVLYDEARTF